jgi:hypothetical protein
MQSPSSGLHSAYSSAVFDPRNGSKIYCIPLKRDADSTALHGSTSQKMVLIMHMHKFIKMLVKLDTEAEIF